jgi:transposase
LACADQGYTGERAQEIAQEQGIMAQVARLLEAEKEFVVLPTRWAVERSCGCPARFRRLSHDYGQLPEVLGGLHFLVFAVLMHAPSRSGVDFCR